MATTTNGLESTFDRLIETRIAECFDHLDPEQPMPRAPAAMAIDIVIPVHDAFDAFDECLRRVLAHTDARHRLILIDDASTDPRVWEAMLAAAREREGIEPRRQSTNLGYLRTVNRAIAASDRDIVLLNSDAMVGPVWVDRLARAAHAEPAIGIACPLSDNATILSVIDPDSTETISPTIGEITARATRPRLPVAVGFCMYVRRAVFDAIGGFDPAFDPGYGEETDFSLRAWQAGFEIVAATDVLVTHKSGRSFGRATSRLASRPDQRWRSLRSGGPHDPLGVFENDSPRTLTYTLVPPAQAYGPVVFSGRLSVDGIDSEIDGATASASERIFASGFELEWILAGIQTSRYFCRRPGAGRDPVPLKLEVAGSRPDRLRR
jgi:GT2 family glycosyltransferase